MTYYGQFNTDYYIAEYFPPNYVGTCLDVGMGEPINNNNTYHFEQKGWECVCVEPNPNYCTQAVNVRKKVENIACGNVNADDIDFEVFTIEGTNQSAISSLRRDNRLVLSHLHLINRIDKIQVKVRTLDYVLEQNPQITSIDFVSIDTEDTELDVLKGFDLKRWKPKLLVIENNYDEPHLATYLKDFGYIRDKRIEVNDFYILK